MGRDDWNGVLLIFKEHILKANHNETTIQKSRQESIVNIQRTHFESKSQPTTGAAPIIISIVNIQRTHFESKSQQVTTKGQKTEKYC